MQVLKAEEKNKKDNYLGLKSKDERQPSMWLTWLGIEKDPWISKSLSERIKIKRTAYLDFEKTLKNADRDTLEAAILKKAMKALNKGEVPTSHNARINGLNEALETVDKKLFKQFFKTLADAQPYEMIGAGYDRNTNLAEIITLFTYIYQHGHNPVMHNSPDDAIEPIDLITEGLEKGFNINQPGGYRIAIENYMRRLSREIERINNMSPQDLGMTFSEDNVKHIAIVQKLKRAFNRLAAEVEYGKRFNNLPAGKYELEVKLTLPQPNVAPDQRIPGTLYFEDITPGKIFLIEHPEMRYCFRDPDGALKFFSFDGAESKLDKAGHLREEYEKKVAGQPAKVKKPFEPIKNQHPSAQLPDDFSNLFKNPNDPLQRAYFLAELVKRGHATRNLLSSEYDLVKTKDLQNPQKEVKSGYIYLKETGQYWVRDPLGNVHEGSLAEVGLDCTQLTPEKLNDPIFKDAILSVTSAKGYTFSGEKTNQYILEDCQYGSELEHQRLDAKQAMRKKKRLSYWLSLTSAFLITLGQVAIAVFTATGIFAIMIGISCGITNVFLFARDIKALLISLFRGDMFRGLRWQGKAFLGGWSVFALATAIAIGGLVMVSLVALFGFVVQTAPVWLMIGAGIISALTIVGMASLFIQCGASIVKKYRGKTVKSVITETWASLKGFFKVPEFNKEVQDLKEQVEDYETKLKASKMAAGGIRLWKNSFDTALKQEIHAIREQYYPIRGHLRREIFYHYARHISKILFTVFFVPAALAVGLIATYAFSVISKIGTAETIKAVFGWSDKLSSGFAWALTWVFSAPMNGALSMQSLLRVAVSFAAKAGNMLAGVFYGVGTVVNMAYHGTLWQGIKNGVRAIRENPRKAIIPSLRTSLALAFGVAIVLNAYGNGATSGPGLLPIRELLPLWFQKLISNDTLMLISVVSCSTSSAALTTGGIDDGVFKEQTPMKDMQHPTAEQKKVELSPQQKFALEYEQKQPGEVTDPKKAAYFDAGYRFIPKNLKSKNAYEITVVRKDKTESSFSDEQSVDSEAFGDRVDSNNHISNNMVLVK